MSRILTDSYALVFLLFWILWTLWFATCVRFFFLKSVRSSFYLTKRAPWLILMSAIGSYLMMTQLTIRIVFGYENLPAMLDHWFIWLMLPLHFIPYPVRALRIIILYHVRLPENRPRAEGAASADAPDESCFSRLTHAIWRWFAGHPKLTSDRAAMFLNLAICTLAFVIGLARNIMVPENHPNVRATEFNNPIYYVMCTVFGVIVSVFLWLGVYFQHKIHDQLKLVFEMVVVGILWIIFIGLYMITSLAEVRPNVIPSFFVICLSVLSFLMSFGMPIWLAWVSPKDAAAAAGEVADADDAEEDVEEEVTIQDEPESSKDAREILKKGEKVDDVIMGETQWTKLFLEFMGFRMCEEGFYFYQDVQNYRKLDAGLLQAEFHRIRQKFIGLGAPFQVNIPDYMVKSILAKVENAPPTADIFEEAFVENRKVLVTDVFPAFKAWKKTKEFTAQLKAKTDPANWPKVITRQKSTRVGKKVNPANP